MAPPTSTFPDSGPAPRRCSGLALVWAVILCAGGQRLSAQEPVDTAMARRIREEATQRSRVMEYAFELTDVRGPRLAGSPGSKAAGVWTLAQLREIGLANVHSVPIDFGRGWAEERFEIRLVEPRFARIAAVAIPYSAATPGEVTGAAVLAPLPHPELTEAQIAAWYRAHRGKLRGRIVLAHDTAPRPSEASSRWLGSRPTDAELHAFNARLEAMQDAEEKAAMDSGKRLSDPVASALASLVTERHHHRLNEFLRAEGVAAVLYQSASFGGTVGMDSRRRLRTQTTSGRMAGFTWAPPSAILQYEHYNRIVRLLARGVPVRLAIRLDASEVRDPTATFNVHAEIPGTTKADEIVLIGAHLDSWNAATGATDNAAGAAVMIEAMRILRALGVRPARTIRLALWGAHESTGGLGIRTYIRDRLVAGYPAYRNDDTLPRTMRPRPEHAKLSAYYNLDMGAGRIRGIFLERFTEVRPIFEAWGRAFPEITTFHLPNLISYGTDAPHIADEGIPSFQFVQDGAPSLVWTHHSSMDLYEFLHPADLQQSAAVAAFFAYQTAMRDELLPRANTRVPLR